MFTIPPHDIVRYYNYEVASGILLYHILANFINPKNTPKESNMANKCNDEINSYVSPILF